MWSSGLFEDAKSCDDSTASARFGVGIAFHGSVRCMSSTLPTSDTAASAWRSASEAMSVTVLLDAHRRAAAAAAAETAAGRARSLLGSIAERESRSGPSVVRRDRGLRLSGYPLLPPERAVRAREPNLDCADGAVPLRRALTAPMAATLQRHSSGGPAFPVVAVANAAPSVLHCCQCGLPFSGSATLGAGGLPCCTPCCSRARHVALRRAGHLLNPRYAHLPLDEFRQQRLFHHIDLGFPGLQLVHRQPFVFIVNSFLSADECQLLLDKAGAADAMRQQLVGESDASARTSTGCVARRDELPALRRRVARLCAVKEAQLQPLKLSRYEAGQRFAEHCDAITGAGPVDDESDYYADAARTERGTRGVPFRGANRFITLFVYLNDVSSAGGGRTRFRWAGSVPGFYDEPAPSGMGVTRLATEHEQLAIQPERGLAVRTPAAPCQRPGTGLRRADSWLHSLLPSPASQVIHFPATTPETGGFTDRNASHESEESIETKWVAQQFVWSHPAPVDGLAGTAEPPTPLSASVF